MTASFWHTVWQLHCKSGRWRLVFLLISPGTSSYPIVEGFTVFSRWDITALLPFWSHGSKTSSWRAFFLKAISWSALQWLMLSLSLHQDLICAFTLEFITLNLAGFFESNQLIWIAHVIVDATSVTASGSNLRAFMCSSFFLKQSADLCRTCSGWCYRCHWILFLRVIFVDHYTG